jgi:hypothetical protein
MEEIGSSETSPEDRVPRRNWLNCDCDGLAYKVTDHLERFSNTVVQTMQKGMDDQ